MVRWSGACALLGLAAACAAGPSPDEAAGATAAPIVAGKSSDDSQDAVIRLDRYVTGGIQSCSGTLIAENLVLTARHCVTDTADGGFACSIDGKGTAGGNLKADFPANEILVFTGVKRIEGTSKAAARGSKIIHDDATNLCNHDLALIVLDRKIEGAKIAQVRLDKPVEKNATFTAVGWGVASKTPIPDTRQQRAGVKVVVVGPGKNNGGLEVPDGEFMVGESICEGDSGGPALDTDSGAVIGVVSRGGNGMQPDPNNPAASCFGAVNFYAATNGHKDLIQQAATEAEAELWVEGGVDPRLAKAGVACDADAACRSNFCLAGKCVDDCTQSSKCDAGFECKASGDRKACVAIPKDGGGGGGGGLCSTSGGSSGQSALLVVAACVVAVGLKRRRR